MKTRVWKLFLAAAALSVAVCSATIAAPTFPSAIGTWNLVGQEKMSAHIKHYGAGSDVRDFLQTMTLQPDHSFDVGTWQQVKNKVTLTLDEAAFEVILNEYLQESSGNPDSYVDIIKSSGQAMLSKDGLNITTGKISIKFGIHSTIDGSAVEGGGTYSVNFKGTRSVALVSSIVNDNDATPEIVKAFGQMLINNFLTKTK